MEHSSGDYIFGHKSNLSKFKKIGIISSVFSDHNAMRLDINYKKKKNCKKHTWRLITFLNNQQVAEEIKREIKAFLETNDNESMTTQNLWDAAKAALRGTFIAIQPYHQETRETSNRKPRFTPKTTGKRRTKKNSTRK